MNIKKYSLNAIVFKINSATTFLFNGWARHKTNQKNLCNVLVEKYWYMKPNEYQMNIESPLRNYLVSGLNATRMSKAKYVVLVKVT